MDLTKLAYYSYTDDEGIEHTSHNIKDLNNINSNHVKKIIRYTYSKSVIDITYLYYDINSDPNSYIYYNKKAPAYILYTDTGNITLMRWHTEISSWHIIHRKNKPALLQFCDIGNIIKQIYNDIHAGHKYIIEYYKNGNIKHEKYEKYYYNESTLHNLNGPASITYFSNKEIIDADFYIHGTPMTYKEFKEFLYKNKNKYSQEYQNMLKKEVENIFD